MTTLNKRGIQTGEHLYMFRGCLKQDISSLAHNGLQYLDFLRIMSDNLRPESYFEIGTSRGDSTAAFPCDVLCVDPQFIIETSPLGKRKRSYFIQMPSDEFFRLHKVRDFFPSGPDICFLDGLHRFEFLLRDFINTEAVCRPNSVILIHDCLPTNERMAERIMRVDEAEGQSTRTFWTGDVWRILPTLKKYRPDLRIMQLDCDPTGLVACTNLDPDSRLLSQNYNKIVDEMMNLPLHSLGLEPLWSLFPMIDSKYLASHPEDFTAVFNIL
jgi:hypothetical protein